MSTVYVYRLEVEYPEGSLDPGWAPPDWRDISRRLGWGHGYDTEHEYVPPFRWPKQRNYFSSENASKRAHLLRELGANVQILVGKVEWRQR